MSMAKLLFVFGGMDLETVGWALEYLFIFVGWAFIYRRVYWIRRRTAQAGELEGNFDFWTVTSKFTDLKDFTWALLHENKVKLDENHSLLFSNKITITTYVIVAYCKVASKLTLLEIR